MNGTEKRAPKIALALGSGVGRGWAHIGVLRILDRLGIKPSIIAGTSVGALTGAMYLSGHIDSLEEWALSLNKLKIVSYMDMRMRGGGLIGGKRLMSEMSKFLGELTFADLPAELVCVATDLVTGHEVWLKEGLLVDSVRASFSMPGIFAPHKINDRWIVDGALVNPVPVSACYAMGADLVIAVNLNADIIGKARKPGSALPTVAGFDLLPMLEENKDVQKLVNPSFFSKLLFKREYEGPSIMGVMVTSLGIIQDRMTRSRIAGDPPDVHIAPRIGHIGLLEFDRAEELIVEGEAAVYRSLPEIRDALAVYGMHLSHDPNGSVHPA